jgi:hypothetical protein
MTHEVRKALFNSSIVCDFIPLISFFRTVHKSSIAERLGEFASQSTIMSKLASSQSKTIRDM